MTAYLLNGYSAIVGAWFVIFLFATLSRRSIPTLHPLPIQNSPSELNADLPFISIIIPARNEERNIEACVSSVLAVDYPLYELIVVDDRSTDATPKIASRMAQQSNQMQFVSVTELPIGWAGKPHALHCAAQRAKGDWLLFLDADTTIHPQNLLSAIHRVRSEELDVLSLFGGMRCETTCERIVQPLAWVALGLFFRLPHVNSDDHPDVASANGQYILISRSAYNRIGGHAAVSDQLMEDIVLAELAKKNGLRLRMASSIELITVRMYASLGEMLRGWSRIYHGAVRHKKWKLWVLLFSTIVCSLSAYVASFVWIGLLVAGSEFSQLATLIGWNVLHHALIVVTTAPLYRLCGGRARDLWGYLFALIVICVALVRAIWMTFTKKIAWRGVHYSTVPSKHRAEPIGVPIPSDGISSVPSSHSPNQVAT